MGFVFFCRHKVHSDRAQEKSSGLSQAKTVHLRPVRGQGFRAEWPGAYNLPDLLRNLWDSRSRLQQIALSLVRKLHEPMEPKVNFFATCMGVSALPDAALSAVKLLTHCGVKVIFKQDQTCCGQPAYNTVFTDEARRIARYNVELFSDND